MSDYRLTRLPREYKELHYSNEFKIGKRWYYDGKKYITGSLNDNLELSCFIRDDIFGHKIIPEIKSSSNGITIRLLDCLCRETNILEGLLKPTTKKKQSIITPSYAIITRENNQQFRKVWHIAGRLPGLDEWLGTKLTDFDYSTHSFGSLEKMHCIELFADHTTIEVYSKLLPDYENIMSADQFTIQNDPKVTIKFLDKPKDFTSGILLFSMLETFSNFLFSASYQNNIFIYEPNGGSKNRITYAKVFDKRKGKDRFYWEPLFTINDLKDKNIIKDILLEWTYSYEKIKYSVESIMLHLDNNISEDMKFTSLISSLESLHRYFFEEKEYSNDEWNDIRQDILSSIKDECHRKIVEKRLAGPLEASLGKRLKGLVGIGASCGLTTFNKTDINDLVNTRNYYTHRDKNGKEKILSDWNLAESNRIMVKLIKLLILKILKIPDSDLKNIVNKSIQFRY